MHFPYRLALACLAALAVGLAPSLARAGERYALGDLNCDGDVNGFDIDPFVLVLVSESPYDEYYALYPDCDHMLADTDQDGDITGFDIDPFVDLLLSGGVVATELAGNQLSQYPYFECVRAFNEDAPIDVAIDPTRFPAIVGQTGDIYLVQAKSEAEWTADPSLVDVRAGGPQTETFVAGTIQDNTFAVAGPYELNGDAGIGLGVGHDVVLDMNQSGTLDAGDYIDGRGNEAGLYVVHDLTQPGPLAVTEIIYSGGSWLGQDTYYPSNIAILGQLPLVVVSHGNGHNYMWYDHIGYHMASYGYIVMAHQNNTGPGIETASTTTLINTDYIIGAQDTIAGGVLNGHLDSSRIVWIGHSRGGEGITRAYDRIYDGAYIPDNYSLADLVLLSSMAPTDFLGTNRANPHGANYHLWTASGDGDVSGGPGSDIGQTFHLHDRATGFRHSTVLQGVGHGDLHDGGGSSVFTGPCPIGRENTHLIQKGYFLPLIKHYTEGNLPATDFLWRQWESFRPIGAPEPGYCPESGGPAVVVNNTYRNGAASGNFVIDSFQEELSADVSSSGGAVTYTVENLTEDLLNDNDYSFAWTPSDPMNGMTYARATDTTRGVVFDWNGVDRFYEQEIIPAARDFSDDKYLSFRACQGTRHPYTIAELGDLTFSVTLRDAAGTSSSINIGAYGAGGPHGGGVEEPYQRSGFGTGVGWHNEFEEIRIRLTDFLTNGSGLNLTNIVAVRFDFGPSWGSNEGRLGLDEIQSTSDPMPTGYGDPLDSFLAISLPDGAPAYIAPGEETTILVRIVAHQESYVPGSGTLHHRFDGGAFLTSPLVPVGGTFYEATLPPPSCGDTPEFYFSAEGSVSGVVTEPLDAPASVYTAEVGVFVPFYEEMLDTDPGWTTEGLWAYGPPTGGGGAWGEADPTSGYTGPNVYGYNLDGDYEDSMPERHLTSVVAIDCTGHSNVQLAFWRWLGVEQGVYDHAYVRVSNDGTTWHTVWENVGTIEDTSWVYQQLDISQYADDQPTLYLRWTMGTSDSGWHYCGWNIDDISLLALECE